MTLITFEGHRDVRKVLLHILSLLPSCNFPFWIKEIVIIKLRFPILNVSHRSVCLSCFGGCSVPLVFFLLFGLTLPEVVMLCCVYPEVYALQLWWDLMSRLQSVVLISVYVNYWLYITRKMGGLWEEILTLTKVVCCMSACACVPVLFWFVKDFPFRACSITGEQ